MAAKEFGQLPSTVARDMARDPRRLTVTCFPLLTYARCFGEWQAYKGDAKHLEHWKGSETLAAVERNTFDLRAEKFRHRSHDVPDAECRLCKGANRG